MSMIYSELKKSFHPHRNDVPSAAAPNCIRNGQERITARMNDESGNRKWREAESMTGDECRLGRDILVSAFGFGARGERQDNSTGNFHVSGILETSKRPVIA